MTSLLLLTIIILFVCITLALESEEYSLEKKIGQMLLFGFRGAKAADEWVQATHKQLSEGKIGGVLFYGYNIVSPAQLKKLMAFLHQSDAKITPFFAIDQEGGSVQRMSMAKGFTNYPSAQEVADTYDLEQASVIYANLCKECKEYGFNYILAPVLDVNVEPDSPVISAIGRTYSMNPSVIAAYACTFVEEIHKQGMISCLKHFPGHGSAFGDTHKGVTDITDTWQEYELDPYIDLIEEDLADTIMSAHIFDSNVDSYYPASLSTAHIQQRLRDELKYDGIVISDDMQMGAISKYYTLKQTVIQSIKAGNDILIFSQFFKPDLLLIDQVTDIIKSAIKSGEITEARIDQSFARIMKLKSKI